VGVGRCFAPGPTELSLHDPHPARLRCASAGDPPHRGEGKTECADHLIASGLVGDPTAPVIGMAGATNMNS